MRLVLYLGLVAVSSNSTTTIDVPSTLEVASTSEVPSTLEDVARDVQNMAGAHMMDNSLLDDEENDTIMGVGLLMDLLNGEQDADIETLKRAAELLANSDLDTDDDDDDDDGKSFFGLDEQNHGQQDHDLGLRIQPRSRNDNQDYRSHQRSSAAGYDQRKRGYERDRYDSRRREGGNERPHLRPEGRDRAGRGTRGRGGRGREEPPAADGLIESTTSILNAFCVHPSNNFSALHVFHARFSSENRELLTIADVRVKQDLVGSREFRESIFAAFPACTIDYNDIHGVKLFILSSEVPTLSDIHVSRRSRRRELCKTEESSEIIEESWFVTFSPAVLSITRERLEAICSGRNDNTDAAVYQYIKLVLVKVAHCAGISVVGRQRHVFLLPDKIKNLPGRNRIDLMEGFTSSVLASNKLMITVNQVHSPMPSVQVQDELDEAGNRFRELQRSDLEQYRIQVSKAVRYQIACTVYAPYCYKLLNVAWDLDVNSPVPRWRSETEPAPSILDYLNDKHGSNYNFDHERLIRSNIMKVTLVGGHSSAPVFIPACLLRSVDITNRSVTLDQRQLITKACQSSAASHLHYCRDIVAKFTKAGSRARERLEICGLELDDTPVSQESTNYRGLMAIQASADADPAKVIRPDVDGNFMMEFHRAESYHHKANLDMKRTALLFLLRCRDFSRELRTFTESCRVFLERYRYGPSDRPEDYGMIAHWTGDQNELEDLLSRNLNFVFCFVERKNEQLREYSILKIACRARNLPSQVISMEVLKKLKVNCLMSAIPAVLAKHQDSGVPWKMCTPVFDDPFSSAMGIAHYLPSGQNESLKGVTEVSCGFGIYATRNVHGTTTVNDFGIYNRALKGGVMPELSNTLVDFFEKLKSTKGLGCMPQTLYVFRKGVSDSQICDVENYEISAVKKAIEEHSGRVEWIKEARIVRIVTYAVSGIASVKVKLGVATCHDVLDGDMNPKHQEEAMYVKGSVDARPSFDATVEAANLDDYGRAGCQIEVKLPANTTPELLHNPVTLLLPDGSEVELPWRTRLVWMIVNLSNVAGLRLYRSRNGQVVSPVAGSTVAMSRVEGRYEFYAVPCSPKDKIAKPTNYIVILNEPDVPHDDLQRLALQLSSLYFNMKSSIKLPSVVRLAEEAAKQGFGVYGSSPAGSSEKLAYTMANL